MELCVSVPCRGSLRPGEQPDQGAEGGQLPQVLCTAGSVHAGALDAADAAGGLLRD